MAKFGDICDFLSGNAWKSDQFSDSGIPIIRINNLNQNEGEFVYWNQDFDEKYLVNKDDILLSLSGTIKIYKWQGEEALLNQRIVKIQPREGINIDWIYYKINYSIEEFINKAKSGTIKNLSVNDIKDLDVIVPDLETQNKIVIILYKAKAILDKREETIRKYDELLRSTFLDMFGDPVINPKEWEVDSLANYGTLKNGLNYTSNEIGNEVKCIGVGDFKSFWKLTRASTLTSIFLNKQPTEDYFLKNEDLIFVRSNGNKELVGRCIIVYPNSEKITFSGFCIRYRANSNKINMIYLVHLFREPNFRKAMLKNGRGANIQNISQQLLEELKIPIPPIELQEEFASKIEQFELILEKLKKGTNISKQLLGSLSSQVFSERIIIDVNAELEALVNAIDLERKEEDNNINTIKNDLTLLKILIDKLNNREFEIAKLYDKAKYIVFRILKEEPNLVKQNFDIVEQKIKLEI